MRCPKCGTEHNSNFCPNCGEPAFRGNPETAADSSQSAYIPPQHDQPAKRKRNGCLIAALIVAAFIVILVIAASLSGKKGNVSGTSSAKQSVSQTQALNTTKPTQAAKTQPYSAVLTSGHYTAGIDFPAGKYTITAVSGNGNVSSSNIFSGGLNEIMGTGVDSTKEYKNALLTDGVALSVSGVKIKIESTSADKSAIKARTNSATKVYEFGSGNFTAGTDFEPGVYTITVISGNGNVSSSNLLEGGLNMIMGTNAEYEKEFKNAEFKSGDVLTISGVKIKLTPSK